MTSQLATHETQNALATPSILDAIGQAANKAAGQNVFVDYKIGKSENTLRRHENDLQSFSDFLVGIDKKAKAQNPNADIQERGDLLNDPSAWRGITWGLVKAFQKWQLQNSYAVGTINGRLSTIKVYSWLAMQAGELDQQAAILIKGVTGYKRGEQRHIDKKRKAAGIDTRKGTKKADAVTLTKAQADAMIERTETDQGRRDRLLMAVMLYQGLRVGEVAALQVGDFDLAAGELRFYRPKVDKTQTHVLTPPVLEAARDYIAKDAPALGILWRKSTKGNGLGSQGMSERAITKRVKYLGEKVGAVGLSAHDLRHYAATFYARKVNKGRLTFKDFMDIFGWAAPNMALHYIEDAKRLDVAAAYND